MLGPLRFLQVCFAIKFAFNSKITSPKIQRPKRIRNSLPDSRRATEVEPCPSTKVKQISEVASKPGVHDRRAERDGRNEGVGESGIPEQAQEGGVAVRQVGVLEVVAIIVETLATTVASRAS